jgi:PhzF family phenazine biosynthesis protein
MRLPIFLVDAFTTKPFAGNPAAVCPLDFWLDDEIMQKIATENNLSETAFIVNRGDFYQIRWFTPQTEVDLCGHATLASAWVIMNLIQNGLKKITFGSHSGELYVYRDNDILLMDFPAHMPESCDIPDDLIKGLGVRPRTVLASNYYLAIYDSEELVRNLQPYMKHLKELDRVGVVVSAPGKKVDFVSRFFAPAIGIPEDPVTGSAHCTLIPYWAKQLNKLKMEAWQVSARGGELFCEHRDNRVLIGGHARLFLEGFINF